MSPFRVGELLLLEDQDARRLWALCLLERLAVGHAPWERKRNFSWRVLDLGDGTLFEMPESHLSAYYSRLA